MAWKSGESPADNPLFRKAFDRQYSHKVALIREIRA